MANDMRYLSAEEEAKLLKPIDEYVGKIQAQIDALRVDGSDKVQALKTHISLTKEDKNYTKGNAARVIKAVTKTPIKIPEGVEVVDVCKAVEEMMNEREAIGKEEGRAEGRTEGRREGTLATLTGLVKDGILTIKDAALRANMSESAFKAEMER